MGLPVEAEPGPLRILHVFRAPIGGLFRHVLDLSGWQAARGHAVGIICDVGGGERADAALEHLRPSLALGVHRLPMRRQPGPWDLAPLLEIRRLVRKLDPQVLHGHGAKGGLLARAWSVIGLQGRVATAYTPHGGTLNFGPGTPGHGLYMAVERMLGRGTDVFTFESQFAADRYGAFVGRPRGLARVVRNGAHASEFEPVEPRPEAADLVFLGEFREAKGLFVLLDALDLLRRRQGYEVSANLIGGGPEADAVAKRIAALGLRSVTLMPAMAARDALALGRVFVLPSLFESLPYVLIEAAAGGLDIVATRVGGVAEAMGPAADRLVPPGDPAALAAVIAATLDDDRGRSESRREAVRRHVREHLSVDTMGAGIEEAYRAALAARRG
ncbi:glycosyltransferase [Alsobacter sp. R-9]